MVWLIRANLHFEQLQLDDAEFCYTKCIFLEPELFAAHWLRGVARFDSGNIDGADSDFEKVIELRPEWAPAWFNLGVVHQAQGRLAEAEKDMTKAIKWGAVETRIYFKRSELRREMGDVEGADRDRQLGLELTPTDAPNWIAMGVAHYSRSPDLAETDFRNAIELDPQSATAWTNLASVLAERLGRTAEAIEAMNHVIELTPSSASWVATRGVLYARLGRRDEAVQDASNALEMNDGYETKYLVAGVYAQTARSHRPDAELAISFLRAAAWKKPDFVAGRLRIDADLKPLHQLPAFNDLLQTLTELRASHRTL
jgi:tetratricopeptide (TPR) repeat protein